MSVKTSGQVLQDRASSIIEGLTKVSKGLDSRFGEVIVFGGNKNRDNIVQRTFSASNTKDAEKFINDTISRATLNHPHIARLLDYSVLNQKGLCSKSISISQFYQLPPGDLQDQIAKNRPFDHVDLTHIMYQQLHAQAFLSQQNLHHGNIHPAAVTYDRGSQISKLLMSSDTRMDSNALRVWKKQLYSHNAFYASQRVYEGIRSGDKTLQFDPSVEDVYCLGLVLLEAGVGHSIKDIFSPKKGFNQELLNTYLQEFAQRHSDNTLLVSTVSAMLTQNEGQRVKAIELLKVMHDYEQVKPFLIASRNGVNDQKESYTSYVHGNSIARNLNDSTQMSLNPNPGQVANAAAEFLGKFPVNAQSLELNTNRNYIPPNNVSNIVYDRPIATSYDQSDRNIYEPLRTYHYDSPRTVIYDTPISTPYEIPRSVAYEPIRRVSYEASQPTRYGSLRDVITSPPRIVSRQLPLTTSLRSSVIQSYDVPITSTLPSSREVRYDVPITSSLPSSREVRYASPRKIQRVSVGSNIAGPLMTTSVGLVQPLQPVTGQYLRGSHTSSQLPSSHIRYSNHREFDNRYVHVSPSRHINTISSGYRTSQSYIPQDLSLPFPQTRVVYARNSNTHYSRNADIPITRPTFDMIQSRTDESIYSIPRTKFVESRYVDITNLQQKLENNQPKQLEVNTNYKDTNIYSNNQDVNINTPLYDKSAYVRRSNGTAPYGGVSKYLTNFKSEYCPGQKDYAALNLESYYSHLTKGSYLD